MSLRNFSSCLLFTLGAAGCFLLPPNHKKDYAGPLTLRVSNQSPERIADVKIWPCDSHKPGRSWVEGLPPGETSELAIRAGSYTMWLVTDSGKFNQVQFQIDKSTEVHVGSKAGSRRAAAIALVDGPPMLIADTCAKQTHFVKVMTGEICGSARDSCFAGGVGGLCCEGLTCETPDGKSEGVCR